MFGTIFQVILYSAMSIVILVVGVYLCIALIVAVFIGVGNLSDSSDKATVARIAAQRKAMGY